LTQFAPTGDGDPLASLNAELEEIKAKAEEMTERLRAASATVRAQDGAVTVTVGAGGVLQEITFGTKAYKRPPEALSALVMQLIAAAQKEVSAEVYGAFGGLVGESSDAMAVLQEFLPEPDEDEDQTTPPPPPPATPPPPPPPAAPPWQHGPQQPSQHRPSRPAPVEDNEDNEPW
jgi:DNA-binding protein YbaB